MIRTRALTHGWQAVSVAGLVAAGLSAAHAQAPAPSPAPPAPAAPSAAAAAPAISDSQAQVNKALAQLFENVAFWSQRGQPQMALQELERVLVLAPNDPDSLATAARLAFQNGLFDAGKRYVDQLQKVAPTDPRLRSLNAERPLTAADLQTLSAARAASVAGRKDDSVKLYQQLFNGGSVPDSLAVEYYIALGTSSPQGFEEANAKLGAVANRWPTDAAFKLAYAQLQTYNEATRAAGIDMLRQLSQVPSIATGAKQAWRDALLWQGADSKTREQIVAYLDAFPGDPQLQAKLKELQDDLPDEGVLDRMRAYEADAAGNTQAAESGFLAALAHDPNDAEAMIMLSIIRRHQGRLAESDQLIAKAMQAAPDRHDEFVKTIGFDPATISTQLAAGRNAAGRAGQGGGATGDGGLAARRAYQHVNTLADRGQYAAAEAELRRLMGPRPAAGSYVQLGYIQLRAGELAPAEASFRRVLASSPRNAAALGGLAGVYARQGNDAAANEIYARLGTTPGAAGVGQQQATTLRTQAQASTDPAEKARLYRAAIAADPANPWLKLEFARILYGRNQQADARAMMADVAAGSRPTSDQVQAALIWAQEHNDAAQVERLVAELPANKRTPQILELEARSRVTLEVDRASAAGSPAAVRSALLAIAAQPDPAGTRGQAVGQALIKAGDRAAVRDAVRAGLSSTPSPTAAQRLLYAGLLSQAGLNAEARVLLRQVSPGSLQPLQRTAYNGLADGLAIQRADQLNGEGRRADAFEVLTPRLQADPQSTGVNLAVSRLYAADGRPQQALRVAEATLQRAPSDLDATRATVGAALQAGDIARARQLAAQAAASQPDDPRTYLIQADVARSQGESGVALAALRRARTLRQEQLSQPQ